MKARESCFGAPGFQTYKERALASGMLDPVRCSITAASPQMAVYLVEAFRRSGEQGGKWGRLELVRVCNGFHPSAEPPADGARAVLLNVLYHGGERHVPRSGGQLHVCIV